MSSGYPYPRYGAGVSGRLSTPDEQPSRYPTAAPLPAHYPVPGAPGGSAQHYPAATHANPLSGPSTAAHAPPPASPWGFPDHHGQAVKSPPELPASRPDNMSSLTNYCVELKHQFILPPTVPPANLEPMTACFHNLTTTVEDEILSDADAQRLEAAASDQVGAAGGVSADLLGGLSALDVGGTSGAGFPLPSRDAQSVAIDLYTQMKAGSVASIQLALAKYSAEDEEQILAFCEHFDRCKEVASEASDMEIAAALFATDRSQGQWRQEAMHVLMPHT